MSNKINLIDQVLAWVFDYFKTKRPALAAVVILILGTLHYFFTNGGEEYLGDTGAMIGYWVTFIFAALANSSTYHIKNGNGGGENK